MQRLRKGLIVLVALAAALAVGWWGFVGITGTSPIVRFGSMMWIPVTEHTFFLSKSVRLALHRPVPEVSPGAIHWQTLAPGFSVGELPVMMGELEVDRVLLARIDPKRYRFKLHNDRTGSTDLDRWMHRTGALLVVNGSYYGKDGGPATPAVIDGVAQGPKKYSARQGAFVASGEAAGLHDLQDADWREVLRGADTALVSYPLLLAADGSNRAPRDSGWIANRSFLAQDKSGRILIGTTKEAFFSLYRLGEFLKVAPLDLIMALDLDGGPVACQAVSFVNYHRENCGHWEVQVDKDGHAKMLPTTWQFLKPPMPLAIAVYARPTGSPK